MTATKTQAKDEQQRFLSEIAQLTKIPEAELISSGYLQSIPCYIDNGKTPHQVASSILSAHRHTCRHNNA